MWQWAAVPCCRGHAGVGRACLIRHAAGTSCHWLRNLLHMPGQACNSRQHCPCEAGTDLQDLSRSATGISPLGRLTTAGNTLQNQQHCKLQML